MMNADQARKRTEESLTGDILKLVDDAVRDATWNGQRQVEIRVSDEHETALCLMLVRQGYNVSCADSLDAPHTIVTISW